MKKILIAAYLIFIFACNITAQDYNKNCYYGISFEVSQNKSWGYGELVITEVEPNSPAEASGIKVNDIIMEINGKATFLRDNETIAEWLFDNPDPQVKFTIRNTDTYFKEYILNRECITVNSVNEHYLSTIFSFYSFEDTRQLTFTLPLQVTPNEDVDYTDYHTFNFYEDGESAPAIESRVRAILEQNLIDLGLKKSDDPDIWVQIYYGYTPNTLYTGSEEPSFDGTSFRFNMATKEMTKLPIYDNTILNGNIKGQYITELGMTFYDKKNIDKDKYTQIWDCNIKDYMSTNYPLEEYIKFHTPLMLMQYPYSTLKTEAEYFVSFNRYNYTGIHFDADDLSIVNDVSEDSPAFDGGIRAGYTINKINGKPFDFSNESLSESYKHFIAETMNYRDQSTRFNGIEGYEDCMYWSVGYYSDIAKQFDKSKYMTNFSYLYDFAKYVNPKSNGSIRVEAWDGIQRRLFNITPKIRQSVVIKAF